MYTRFLNPLLSQSFFLFGARGVGKSTFLKQVLLPQREHIYINLLDPAEEDLFAREPRELSNRITTKLKEGVQPLWVVIDEVQKVPALLNLVHHEIEERQVFFALTGSSARKLKRGAANLLAGRAFMNALYPLTYLELGEDFDLSSVLRWGALPKIFSLDEASKNEYLSSYVLTYLKEEVVAEQLVRNVQPFRSFLPVAAQCSGKILNFSNIARDVQSDPVSVRNYFEILEDTHIGYLLPSYETSIRRRVRKNPKFYLFDLGVKRALERTLEIPVRAQTYEFGELFEHFLILELIRLAHYSRKRWEFFYLRTRDDVEIDLVIDRPGQPPALIEIKSTERVTAADLSSFARIAEDFGRAERFCLSRDPTKKTVLGVECLPWDQGLRALLES